MKSKLLAIVGMPGAGKSEVIKTLGNRGIPCIRFGEQTDVGLREKGLPITPENEQRYREAIRKELGMAAYAIKAEEKIKHMLSILQVVAIDGLYSWEEYLYIKERFPQLFVVAVIAEPEVRYTRLKNRSVRPFSPEEAAKRDIAEIENLHKAGPIAIADYFIENNGQLLQLQEKIEALLERLKL